MKRRSSEGHPSLLEDGRVATSQKEFQIRTVVNAVLGECIWNLSYNERRMAIELELTNYLEEEDVDALINQFPVLADYDGIGPKGTKFVFYI